MSDENVGYVYVATNPAMEGFVKIGSTKQSVEKRLSDLYATGVPLPFDLVHAAEIEGDPRDVELTLHEVFDPQRVNPRREFFEIDPGQPVAILKLLGRHVRDITEETRAKIDDEQLPADRQASQRRKRPPLRFDDLGLLGTTLTYRPDNGVRAEIVDASKVRLVSIPDGHESGLAASEDLYWLSSLTTKLRGKTWNVQASPYWTTESGRLLLDLYNEVHGS